MSQDIRSSAQSHQEDTKKQQTKSSSNNSLLFLNVPYSGKANQWDVLINGKQKEAFVSDVINKSVEQMRKQKYRNILDDDLKIKQNIKDKEKKREQQEYVQMMSRLNHIDQIESDSQNIRKQYQKGLQQDNMNIYSSQIDGSHGAMNYQTHNQMMNLEVQLQKERKEQQKEKVIKKARQQQYVDLLNLQNQDQQKHKLREQIMDQIEGEIQKRTFQDMEQKHQREINKLQFGYNQNVNTFVNLADKINERKAQEKALQEVIFQKPFQQKIIQDANMQEELKKQKKQLYQSVDHIVHDQLFDKMAQKRIDFEEQLLQRELVDKKHDFLLRTEIQNQMEMKKRYQQQQQVNHEQETIKKIKKNYDQYMNPNEFALNHKEIHDITKEHLVNDQKGNIELKKPVTHIYDPDYQNRDREQQMKYIDRALRISSPTEKVDARLALSGLMNSGTTSTNSQQDLRVLQSRNSLPQLQTNESNNYTRNHSPGSQRHLESEQINLQKQLKEHKYPNFEFKEGQLRLRSPQGSNWPKPYGYSSNGRTSWEQGNNVDTLNRQLISQRVSESQRSVDSINNNNNNIGAQRVTESQRRLESQRGLESQSQRGMESQRNIGSQQSGYMSQGKNNYFSRQPDQVQSQNIRKNGDYSPSSEQFKMAHDRLNGITLLQPNNVYQNSNQDYTHLQTTLGNHVGRGFNIISGQPSIV